MRKSIYRQEHNILVALLREIRHECGLRQQELASRLKQPQSFVSKYESGERRLDVIELRQICATIGIALPVFIQRFEERLADQLSEQEDVTRS